MAVSNGLDRRSFILGMSCTVAATALIPACSHHKQTQWLISTVRHDNGDFLAVAISQSGELLKQVPLPAQGCASLAIPHKPGHALIFTAAPHSVALEVNFIDGTVVKTIESGTHSQLCGHGVFSSNGRYLYTTQSHRDSGEGFVVVRDTTHYIPVNQFNSGGIAPEAILPIPNSSLVVLANTGLQKTDYASDNIHAADKFVSNLTYLDIESGEIKAQIEPPHAGQVIRHLDVNSKGKVFIGMQHPQHQGKEKEVLPLVYSHHKEKALTPCTATSQQLQNMQSSTDCVKVQNNLLAVSCSKGKCITFLNADTLNVIDQQTFQGAAGLTLLNNNLIASSDEGKLRFYHNRVNLQHAKEQTLASLHFDNHMTAIHSV